MNNHYWLYKTTCGISAVLLLFLAFSPLITLAFYNSIEASTNTTIHEDNNSTNQNTEPIASYLDEQPPQQYSNKPIYDIYTVAERANRNLSHALPAVTPYYGEKTVYLTFDDGPDPDNTPIVLDILKANNIKATFFVIGNNIEKHPDILKRIYVEGHAIGNHSYNHVYRDLYKSPKAYIDQLQTTDTIIKNVIGVRPRISRAPGGSAGSFTKAYWELLKSLGYIEVGWNVSSGDASTAKAPQIINNIAYQMENKFLWSHAIVLMHDGRGHTETVAALPEIIKYFKERGFEFRVINLETPPAW